MKYQMIMTEYINKVITEKNKIISIKIKKIISEY